MHEITFYLAATWMTVLLAVSIVAMIKLPTTPSRILALDTFTVILVAVLVLYADAQRTAHFMDIALVLSLLAFIGTLAAARYYGERKIF